ncbi:GntR family transcriptional regulator [[Clostridium] symbiosum]|uniref:GntR family transcriptional regulator n=1 Tax=Clostridium symbiosum TaxID=1512 RepID=UPI001D08857C|nr:GntR family transcriptional regulator [[Clostridium] symbiosum]MCB6610508.1 GntR family transcriptional regulator [[Clostridium] symbiosum]MCB6929950.1 GntR family transcriptional regulator [[Clostridium] symbiosum]
MKNDMERCQVVYGVLKTHIQFGAYRFGDVLPTMENNTENFLVSLDTIRSAYLQLEREGYVTLSQNVGSTVIKDYSDREIEENVQLFFSLRKHALIDLSKSLRPLFTNAQWLGLKNAPSEIYANMMELKKNHGLQPFIAFNHIMQAYDSLGNDLLTRLLWQVYMFFEAPFLCVPKNPWYDFAVNEFSPLSLEYCLNRDWDSLHGLIRRTQDSLSMSLCRFYEERITLTAPEEISFTWNSYKKASQICYSLAMDLLIDISLGRYPANTLLPSLNRLSKERNVSVSTARRTISLLNGIGAVQSVKRIGTMVLSFDETAVNCDFSNPVVRRRLMDMAQSLQILTLSCKAVSEITIPELNAAEIQKGSEQLATMETRRMYQPIAYDALDLLRQFAPCQAVRTIYGELLKQLFWGYGLRSMWKDGGGQTDFYISYYKALLQSLKEKDSVLFSGKLEELMIHEFRLTISKLVQLGIEEAKGLLIPDL